MDESLLREIEQDTGEVEQNFRDNCFCRCLFRTKFQNPTMITLVQDTYTIYRMGGLTNYSLNMTGRLCSVALFLSLLQLITKMESIDTHIFLTIWILYGIFSVVYIGYSLYRIDQLYHIYNWAKRNLKIKDIDYQSAPWELFVERISNYFSGFNWGDLTPRAWMASIINRKRNFLLAVLANSRVNNLLNPRCFGIQLNYLRMTVNNSIDLDYTIGRSTDNLKFKLKLLALAHLIFMPIFMLIGICYLVIRFVESMRTGDRYFGFRYWSSWARWCYFHRYNELPHLLDSRLLYNYEYAEKYIKTFPDPVKKTTTENLSFMFGSMLAVIWIYALTNSNGYDREIYHKSLLAWMTILSALLGFVRSMAKSPEPAQKWADILSSELDLPLRLDYLTKYRLVLRLLPLLPVSLLHMAQGVITAPFWIYYQLIPHVDEISNITDSMKYNIRDIGQVAQPAYWALFDNHPNQCNDDLVKSSFLHFNGGYRTDMSYGQNISI